MINVLVDMDYMRIPKSVLNVMNLVKNVMENFQISVLSVSQISHILILQPRNVLISVQMVSMQILIHCVNSAIVNVQHVKHLLICVPHVIKIVH